MRAVVWHTREDVRVEQVPDPRIEEPTDAIVRVTSSGICGSDLHLYSPLGSYMRPGDILGHEPIGIVEEVGAEVPNLRRGDRVVVPFNVSCGACFYCARGLESQCESTQNREKGKGASLFGYTYLYGGIPGAQAEYVRVPQAQYGPIPVPEGPPDGRFLYLSDVLPTAWQAVRHAEVPRDGVLGIFGLGPIGQMCVRVAPHLGVGRIVGLDLVPERLETARRHGAEVMDVRTVRIPDAIRDATNGRGFDSVVDAVGMEAEGSVADSVLRTTLLQVDSLTALRNALASVRRGGTVSVVGVYAGAMRDFPLGDLFDRQISIRMGQANVRRWVPDVLPLLGDDDPLGTEDFATHVMPLEEAPRAYEMFQKKQDGAIKIVLRP